MPHNKRHMEQLETEITRVQIELRQIRQMIGSLIRTEEQTMQMISHQPGMQTMQGNNQSVYGNQNNQGAYGMQGNNQSTYGNQSHTNQSTYGNQNTQSGSQQAYGSHTMQGNNQGTYGNQSVQNGSQGQYGTSHGHYGGTNQSATGMTGQGTQVPSQLINEERRAMEQYSDMRNIADRLDKQVQGIAQAYNLEQHHNPDNRSARQMNPPYNDPMQRQF